MHLTRHQFQLANLGALGPYVAYEEPWLAMQKDLPAFRWKCIGHSLGRPEQITILAMWESRAALLAVRDQQIAFGKSHPIPADVARRIAPIDAWTMIDEIAGPRAGEPVGFVTTAEWQLWGGSESPAAFISSRREYWSLHATHGASLAHYRLFRHADAPNQLLVVATHTSQEGAREGFQQPAVVAFDAAHRVSAYTTIPPVMRSFDPLLVG